MVDHILYQHASEVKWEPYNKLHVANYERVHYDTKSDVVVLRTRSKENTFTRAIQGKWLSDKVTLGKVINMETKTPMYAFNAGVKHRSLKGLDPRINPDKPPRNFGDAMKAKLGQRLTIRSILDSNNEMYSSSSNHRQEQGSTIR